jgi:hypothetical protein
VKRSQRGTETEVGDGDERPFKCGAETAEDCGVFARPLFHRTGVSSLWRDDTRGGMQRARAREQAKEEKKK